MAKIKKATKKTGKERKEQIVAELVEKINASTGLVFVDYKGITHKQLEDLKKELKRMDATIVIAKNTLLKLSLGKSRNFADFKDNEALELPTATLFIRGDMVEPLKKLQRVIKELGLPKVKFGILEGSLTDEAGVLKIASLPGRSVLIAQFVGTLNAPIQGFVFALNGTIQKFVTTLDAVAKSKPSTPPAAVTDEVKAEPVQKSTEEAAPAAEPAEQSDAPITTDENPGEQTKRETNETEEQKSEGGEN